MTKLAVVSTERRQNYEVCRLHSANVGNCVPHIHLRFHTLNNNRTIHPHPCNHRGLLHNLAMLEGEGQGRQSNGGIPVQEDRVTSILLLDGGVMGTDYHIPSGSCYSECSDRNSSRVLGSADKQPDCLEKVTQKELCVG